MNENYKFINSFTKCHKINFETSNGVERHFNEIMNTLNNQSSTPSHFTPSYDKYKKHKLSKDDVKGSCGRRLNRNNNRKSMFSQSNW